MEHEVIEELAAGVVEAGEGGTVALTGAGISTESGIPDFRSPGGLWEQFDPMEYATIQAFRKDPLKVWRMLREMDKVIEGAAANEGHRALARLEQRGLLAGIVTQNIDNLHQEGGSKKVIEFHGNARRLRCLRCNDTVDAEWARAGTGSDGVPRCPRCDAVLKPDAVFFGEPIPPQASAEAMRLAQQARLLLVVGTSALVAPASYIPVVAKKMGARLAVINLEETVLSGGFADFELLGKAGEVLTALADAVDARLGT